MEHPGDSPLGMTTFTCTKTEAECVVYAISGCVEHDPCLSEKACAFFEALCRRFAACTNVDLELPFFDVLPEFHNPRPHP